MPAEGWPRILPAGDSALLVTFGDRIDRDINRRVHALARALADASPPGLVDSVPGYVSLLVAYDPLILTYARLEELLRASLAASELVDLPERLVEIPVAYGGEYGPDLAFVAKHNHLTEEEVVRIHTGRDYPVFLMGFMPGFPYLGGLDPRIAAPRLTPRAAGYRPARWGLPGSRPACTRLNHRAAGG